MSNIHLPKSEYYDEITKIAPSIWPIAPISGTGTLTSARVLSALGLDLRDKIVRELVDDGYWVKATGSRVTKSGYTSESDWDYVVYDPDNHLVNKLLADSNWSKDVSGNGDPGIDFHSFKNGMTNLILVSTEDIWKKYIIATNLIKSLDCKTKKERVTIFDSVFERDRNLQAVEF